MLWLQCFHNWIWYFGHGCRKHWRSLGMCDHRAFWPHGYMSASLVWVRRHGPSHPWTSPPGPLWNGPQPTATHSHNWKWQPLRRLVLSLKCRKNGVILLHCTSEGSVITSSLNVGDWWVRTCHVRVIQLVRLSTSVIWGPEASGLGCHLLDGLQNSSPAKKEKQKRTIFFLKWNF